MFVDNRLIEELYNIIINSLKKNIHDERIIDELITIDDVIDNISLLLGEYIEKDVLIFEDINEIKERYNIKTLEDVLKEFYIIIDKDNTLFIKKE